MTALDNAIPGLQSDDYEEKTLSKKELEERERQRKRNQKKKQKKKNAKQRRATKDDGGDTEDDEDLADDEAEATETEPEVEIEYVAENPTVEITDPNFFYFTKVFQAFKLGERHPDRNVEYGEKKSEKPKPQEPPTKAAIVERIVLEEEEEKREKQKEQGENKLSKRKMRIAMRPSIAELKATCLRPDVVEWHDVTSKDPKLLVHLKSLRNTVPVPRHWCFKRKYLAGKRGFERGPFQLPEFIRRTGIMEMRQSLWDKEEEKSLKTKMRERVRPKLGRIDIDYQKLHDAFFRWQTKPKMTILGDLYFEGKELETRLREKKPGELTDDIRIALGMPVGPNAMRFPPPWLIAMQRYGPPPSYPNLLIPGLNAPIPEGCSFGYHAGGWGKPPVDENGKPLYGDVFGVEIAAQPSGAEEAEIERRAWGEMESEESAEEEEEEEDEQPPISHQDIDETGLVTPAEGLMTPSGISSGLPTGLETPETIELRKRKQAEPGVDTPGSLYTVLPEKRVERIAGQMMASTHVYDVASQKKDKTATESGVDVALNPDELDLQDPKGLQRKYEEGMKQRRGGGGGDEDFSDMVAEHSARQKRKRKHVEEKKTSSSSSEHHRKKHRDFKF